MAVAREPPGGGMKSCIYVWPLLVEDRTLMSPYEGHTVPTASTIKGHGFQLNTQVDFFLWSESIQAIPAPI